MRTRVRRVAINSTMLATMGVLLAVFVLTAPRTLQAATAGEINRDVDNALATLYRTTPAAGSMAKIAKGILVFPNIIKGGLIIGGQYGEGALRVDGVTTGYYKTVAASYGLQAGAQTFGYALFFINNDDLNYLRKSEGWEIGIGPSIVIVDEGIARSLTTTTAKSGIYAFIFQQKGLMGGIGIQGSKITQIRPEQ